MTASKISSIDHREWLLDVYPSSLGEMTVWVITENGERLKSTDQFQPKMYVSGSEGDLEELAFHFCSGKPVVDWRFVEKRLDIMHSQMSPVLELDIVDCRQVLPFARRILREGDFRRYRMYNVDIPPGQRYLYHEGLFPFAFIDVQGKYRHLKFSVLNSHQTLNVISRL